MFEIDKAKFGAFVAQLRKEKGLMQKELAEQLYVSDKAVSKWERGLSIPDVAILVPLAEILGVTVTELLECRRLPKDEPMDSRQTEEIVKKVIGLSEEEQRKYRPVLYALVATFGFHSYAHGILHAVVVELCFPYKFVVTLFFKRSF